MGYGVLVGIWVYKNTEIELDSSHILMSIITSLIDTHNNTFKV
jgi:hypothetical protein